MGKGDRTSRRGKIWRGTTGKTRPRTWKGKGATPKPVEPEEKKKK
jgi:ribosomal small subunit protein bTHX